MFPRILEYAVVVTGSVCLLVAAADPVDPYTRNDPEVLRKVGYQSFGPFPWAHDHSTHAIDQALGEVPILWVETEHFKLGSSLAPYRLPRRGKEREKILAELRDLAEVLPNVPRKPRQLDRWLRLHLYAQRLERLYADFGDRLGYDPENPAADSAEPIVGRNMEAGPFLGQTEKFTVLLCEKRSTFGRYFGTFLGESPQSSRRHFYGPGAGFFFGTAEECWEGLLADDTALHCHLVFNLVHNFVNAYRRHCQAIPIWVSEGLAHWFARRVDPGFNNFTVHPQEGEDIRHVSDWAPRIRARARFGLCATTATMLPWAEYGQLNFADHMLIWSRVDYLMQRDSRGFGTYLDHLKSVHRGQMGGRSPADLLPIQLEALQAAWQLTPESFDRGWGDFVKQKYPKKR